MGMGVLIFATHIGTGYFKERDLYIRKCGFLFVDRIPLCLIGTRIFGLDYIGDVLDLKRLSLLLRHGVILRLSGVAGCYVLFENYVDNSLGASFVSLVRLMHLTYKSSVGSYLFGVTSVTCNSLFSFVTVVRQHYRSRFSCITSDYQECISENRYFFFQSGTMTVNSIYHNQLSKGFIVFNLFNSVFVRNLRNSSRYVFTALSCSSGIVQLNGILQIGRFSQSSCAWQYFRFRTLSMNVRVNVSPSLRVIADGVSCSHGCVISFFATDFLNFFSSRGIPRICMVKLKICLF